MIRTGYEIFVRNLEELEGGKELDKQIRSAETYEMKKVGLIKIFKLFCNQRKKKEVFMSNKIEAIITSERFGKGFTYDAYLNQMGANKERFLESEAAFKLSPEDTKSFQNIAKKLGSLKVLVLAEDWSPDVHRALPVLDKIVKAGGMELRIFSRDQNLDIMDLFLNRGEFRSIPTFVFFNANLKYLCHWIERPAVAVIFLEDVDKELAPKNLSLEDRRKERRMRSLPQWNLWRQETAREIKELLSKVS